MGAQFHSAIADALQTGIPSADDLNRRSGEFRFLVMVDDELVQSFCTPA